MGPHTHGFLSTEAAAGLGGSSELPEVLGPWTLSERRWHLHICFSSAEWASWLMTERTRSEPKLLVPGGEKVPGSYWSAAQPGPMGQRALPSASLGQGRYQLHRISVTKGQWPHETPCNHVVLLGTCHRAATCVFLWQAVLGDTWPHCCPHQSLRCVPASLCV